MILDSTVLDSRFSHSHPLLDVTFNVHHNSISEHQLVLETHMNSVRLHMLPQSQLVELLCIGHAVVTHNGVSES